jgi:hypothetical protein
MKRLMLQMAAAEFTSVCAHLLPAAGRNEEAAFLFTNCSTDDHETRFEVVESCLVPPSGFAYRSSAYLELKDETRRSIIKRAHDLSACIFEFHSHPLAESAEFSPSDKLGFAEFVPHVRWRLKKLPYGAVVIARSNFDAVVWMEDGIVPRGLDAIRIDERELPPTGLTLAHWNDADDE